MRGWSFSKWTGNPQGSVFDKLFDIFKELLVYTNGNVDEAISWLTELDKEYNLTSPDYGISDFIEELKVRGYLQQHKQQRGLGLSPSSKMDLAIRRKALDDLFGQIKKAKSALLFMLL